ncbi:MAG: glycosyl hydrolase [Candidatus Omnitrophota bacterium]
MKTAYCEIGAFVGNPNHRPPNAKEIREYEQLIARHIHSVLFFWAWGEGAFPKTALKDIRYHDGYDTGINLHVTWEPWKRKGFNDNSYSLNSIIKCEHDLYISKFARDCRDWSDVIRLRFAHEMIHFNNPSTQGWYPWQDKPEEYVRAWKHIYGIFKNEKADNVEFVWAPLNYPDWFDVLEQYYPGKEYVDWLGIDGYNWGEDGKPAWPYDQNFSDLFYPMYHAFIDHPEIFGQKKIMISETASPKDNQFGGNKSTWIEDMFKRLKNEYSKIEAFYWFNAKKEKDWRVNSSPLSLAAFKNSIQDPYFTSHIIRNL